MADVLSCDVFGGSSTTFGILKFLRLANVGRATNSGSGTGGVVGGGSDRFDFRSSFDREDEPSSLRTFAAGFFSSPRAGKGRFEDERCSADLESLCVEGGAADKRCSVELTDAELKPSELLD